MQSGQFVKCQLLDGRFLTVAPLNHGSFGMVFLAKDTKTGQDVAIKSMAKTRSDHPSSTTDESYEELDSHRRLGYHPNIVNLIHSFETRDRLYLVLEYCANGDLYEAIRLNRGPLETGHVRDFMLQLISAVEFMHASGLYHRDIKPENIFLMQDGSMKLGDFGLATRDEWCQEACVGSDRYMAPEQYEPTAGGSGYCTAKADIWAIGICLLNVLFGRNPFSKPVESDVIFADYARDRQSIFDVFPNMSQDTYEILSHALTFDPEKRSLSGLRDAIARAISFTTDDEALDDFCTEDRTAMIPASVADREPLRTPSIQSPNANQAESCFPWAKALQCTPPQAIRQLSPGSDSYSEELFPPSEMAGSSWLSEHTATPSKDSFIDSESYKSAFIPRRRFHQAYPPPSDPVPITGSLPSRAFKPLLPSLSMVFGKNHSEEQISKSWSDLWDEEEEESENEGLPRRIQNSRSWSRDSANEYLPKGLCEPSSFVNKRPSPRNIPEYQQKASYMLPDSATPRASAKTTTATTTTTTTTPLSRSAPKNSSSSSGLDKWAALGDRRRNYKPAEKSYSKEGVMNPRCCWRKDWGLGSSGFDYGLWVKKRSSAGRYRSILDRDDWRRSDSVERLSRNNNNNNGYDGSVDEDLDLVGGWHDMHL